MSDAEFWILLGFDIFLLVQLMATWFWFFFKIEDYIRESVQREVGFQVSKAKLDFQLWVRENLDYLIEDAKWHSKERNDHDDS